MQKSVWPDLVASMLSVYQYSLEKKDKTKISELLKHIKGIGPKVIDNFFELRGLS